MRDTTRRIDRSLLARPGSLAAAFAAATVGAALPARAQSDLPPEIGYNYGEIETPRTAAMADALRAFSNSTEALFINPANMAASRIYHIGAMAQIWPQANRQSYGGAIVDSVVSSAHVAGGFGGTWTSQDPDGIDRTALDLRFALAFPFSKAFFVGAGGRYLSLEEDGFPKALNGLRPSPASGGLDQEAIVKTFSFDAGFTLKPVPELAIALVGNNLSNPGHGFLPLTFGGGAGFGTDDLTVEADLLGDFTTWDTTKARAMAGFELLAGDHFPLRAGYRFDSGAESHALGGGIGYLDRSYTVDLAIRSVVSGDSSTTIVIGFKYHLESTGITPGPTDNF